MSRFYAADRSCPEQSYKRRVIAGEALFRPSWNVLSRIKCPALLETSGMSFGMVKASLGLFLFAWCAAGILPLQGADWKIAAIDSTGTGYFSSLRIDKNGNAHVA